MVGLQTGLLTVYDAGESAYNNDGVRTVLQNPEKLFQSRVSWQEGLRSNELHEFEMVEGLSANDVDYTVYLNLRSKIDEITIGAKCELQIGDQVLNMTVIKKRKIDSKVYLKSN